MRKKEGRDGVAMIMVLAMLVIFAALIVAVVISSTTAIRRAHFYKDKATALQVAQAGIEEVLYRMNYSQYDTGTYPAFTTPSEDIIPPGFLSGAVATLSVDSSCETKLISIGRYRGRTAQVEVNIKGYAHIGNHLKPVVGEEPPHGGIPEAFNKHTIYAINTVEFSTIPTGVSVRGNVTAGEIQNRPAGLSGVTWTETPINLSDMVHFETSACSFSVPIPAELAYDDTYTETGMLINSTYPGGVSVNATPDPAPGVYWDGLKYLFGRYNISTPEDFNSGNKKILVNADVEIPSDAGNVIINNYFKTTGSLTIDRNITTTTNPNFCLDVAGALTITSGITIAGDLVVKGPAFTLGNNNVHGKVVSNENVTVSGGTIDGDVISNKNILVMDGSIRGNLLSNGDITVNDGTINGCVVCYNASSSGHTISISGGTIVATSSDYDAAVYIHNSYSGSSGTIMISGSPTITLGEHQRAGISIVAPTGSITISSPFTLNYPSDPPDQFAIVNYSGASSVNINASNLVLRGSIYSYQNITLDDNTQTITGILVAGKDITIGNNSTIIYDPGPYLQNSQVYKGFKGGRRRYVPVPGSWRVVW